MPDPSFLFAQSLSGLTAAQRVLNPAVFMFARLRYPIGKDTASRVDGGADNRN